LGVPGQIGLVVTPHKWCDNHENCLTAGLVFAEFFEWILLKFLVQMARDVAAFHVLLLCLGWREVWCFWRVVLG